MSEGTDPAVAAARAYEDLHVRALFQEWAEPVLDAAAVSEGDAVADVACGTGAVARNAWRRVGVSGKVTGLDIAPGMIVVAERIEPRVQWVIGSATDLPFDDDVFDAVVCSFGMMFFDDREQAVREMLRCARPEGRVVATVWDSLERSEAYPTTVELLERRAGRTAADALRAPFVLGDRNDLAALFEQAGASEVEISTRVGTARFPDVRTMVEADLRGWLPLMGVDLDEETIAVILQEAEAALAEHVTPEGELVFAAPGHVIRAAP